MTTYEDDRNMLEVGSLEREECDGGVEGRSHCTTTLDICISDVEFGLKNEKVATSVLGF
jgi:hypothetical protein